MANNKKKDEIMKLDLYKLLEIPEDANEKQVRKAFRTRALKCHPDKNPDNPRAVELFHQLTHALEILSDLGARAAYDHVLRARKAAKQRTEKLDSKRRKVKEDLEAREKAAEKCEQREKKTAKTNLKQEIERLREEGSRILEEEQRYMREQMKKEENIVVPETHSTEAIRLKLRWQSTKDDPTNGGYNEEIITKMFSKYTHVNGMILSKKKGSAIIELADVKAADLAKSVELGLPKNPLKISWLSGQPVVAPSNCEYGRNSSP
uniref:DnaJ homolog subfamily C member 17 n=1 Tax=Ciona savignyi TaxID=51511 RepID=H2ZFJ0_CIOSA